MAIQTKVIKQKISSVRNIKKITKTMEMVSVSKMKRATVIANNGKPYAHYALALLSNIAGERHVEHPLLEVNENVEKELVIVISSNKGLCGAYNVNISKALGKYSKGKEADIDCITIGKQSEKSARRNGLNIISSFVDLTEKSTAKDFLSVRDIAVEKFLNKEYSKVSVLFTDFKSSSVFKPKMMKLLPIEEGVYKDELLEGGDDIVESKDYNLSLYVFEPSLYSLLNAVLPQLVSHILYHSFLESMASEHSSRMFAMKNAGDNAGELLNDLILYYNQARQAGITQEISEIVGGVEAMK